ncbi:MAG: ATP-binding cassette domain-containing protein [Owenweeksia sp.]|nr:ATP-binding cassette domain-containing protein [Owenweeksia sp.]
MIEVLDAENPIKDQPDARAMADFSQEINFKEVSFAYEPDGKKVLEDINLVVPKGQTIALVGQSGSGKTTLTNLVPRFYDVEAGQLVDRWHTCGAAPD